MPDKYYKNTIWTVHALQRLSDRRLTQSLVWKAFAYPDHTYPQTDGSTEYLKRFGIYKITVIVKKDDRGRPIIISCWMDPPFKGTPDALKRQRYFNYKNGHLLTKIWLQFLKHFFGQNF